VDEGTACKARRGTSLARHQTRVLVMMERFSEFRVDCRLGSSHAALRAERPRPSDPGGDEDVPDDQEIERGREGDREQPAEPRRDADERAGR
jgi:hypothetical protein